MLEAYRPSLRRRDLLVALSACALATAASLSRLGAEPKDPSSIRLAETSAPVTAAPPEPWEVAIRAIVGDAKVADGRMVFDVPGIAENGNVVPLNISVPSAMTANDFVRSIHIVSTGNPQPLVATFRFSPDSGKAVVSSRMRLAKTQDVIALAELGDGTFLRQAKTIKVSIGGCGG